MARIFPLTANARPAHYDIRAHYGIRVSREVLVIPESRVQGIARHRGRTGEDPTQDNRQTAQLEHHPEPAGRPDQADERIDGLTIQSRPTQVDGHPEGALSQRGGERPVTDPLGLGVQMPVEQQEHGSVLHPHGRGEPAGLVRPGIRPGQRGHGSAGSGRILSRKGRTDG